MINNKTYQKSYSNTSLFKALLLISTILFFLSDLSFAQDNNTKANNNNDSDTSPLSDSILGAVIGAIGGSGLSFGFLYWNEKRKDSQFTNSIRTLVRYELSTLSKYLEELKQHASNEGNRMIINNNSSYWNTAVYKLTSYPEHFPNMNAETKAKVFDPTTLGKVQEAYRDNEFFMGALQQSKARAKGNEISFNMIDIDTVITSIMNAEKAV